MIVRDRCAPRYSMLGTYLGCYAIGPVNTAVGLSAPVHRGAARGDDHVDDHATATAKRAAVWHGRLDPRKRVAA
eukprot:SAG31_NODE_12241_length_956_cov_1.211202_2_plen_74_part_01